MEILFELLNIFFHLAYLAIMSVGFIVVFKWCFLPKRGVK